jgi:predicted nuclease of predicted toxin-antitoxin system
LNLRDFAFLTDENIHPEVVRLLRDRGQDLLDVKESGLVGSSDLVILRKACAENRIVLTHDSDFGRLAVAGLEPVVGIVYLRPGHIEPVFTMGTLDVLFERIGEIDTPFMVVAERSAGQVKIRLRQL